MTRVKRYWNVSAPASETVHRLYSATLVEGNPTACGIRVRKGWAVGPAKAKWPRWGDLLGTRCKRCDK